MSHMPEKNPETFLMVMAWLSQHAPMFYAAALSCWIAFLRVIYGGGGRRQALLESCLCGAITAGAFPLLEYFNLPSSLAAALGAVIGTLGVKKVADLADRFTDFKLPKRE
ncbi:phage holin, lambda family [Pseudomonas umsongensis]|uniref:phage holin, lambda family n=1 Tax=Pseudomonas umsongensis TaxID=198618 RepID=UPI00200B9267|nr:phage holin, lambda family [Pseudomonas umsongensis]MCK8688117.1 phage holin, lambda family [Pseudomonas umsongensis]